MLQIQISVLFLQIFIALGHFPVPTLLQNKAGDDIGVNQGREHKMELDHVQITKELEDKILDEIDQRLADLEDIDVDAKILVRHMDKHSNFQGYESNVNTLNSIEENVLEAYKVELNLMKRRIIGSNHDLKVNDMEDMNKILDMAEETVNQTRDMIDSFIDVHVDSEEHQHEHDHEQPNDHDHDEHDSFEDYSDLLSNETEASDYEESLIERTIEKGLKDLDDVKNHSSQMEEHLQDHRDSKDHVNTNTADSVLQEIQVNDVEEYKERLLELRKQVGESKGHIQMDFVDKIVSTLERANIFVEVSRNRLHIADQLDDEASNDHRGDGHDHVDDSSLSLEEAEEGPKESNESYENDNDPDDDDIIDDEAEVDEGPIVSSEHANYNDQNEQGTHINQDFEREEEVENNPDVVKKDLLSEAEENNELDSNEFVEEDKVRVANDMIDDQIR